MTNDYHEDVQCAACGGPLETDRDAVCHACSPECKVVDLLNLEAAEAEEGNDETS